MPENEPVQEGLGAVEDQHEAAATEQTPSDQGDGATGATDGATEQEKTE